MKKPWRKLTPQIVEVQIDAAKRRVRLGGTNMTMADNGDYVTA